jgi:hypothetical protein
MLLRTFAATLLLAPVFAFAQKGTFDILIGGHPAGHDTYTLAQSAKGTKVEGRYTVKFSYRVPDNPAPITLDADRTDELRYDPDLLYLEGSSEDMEEHHITGFVPSKPRSEMVVTYKYNGAQKSDPLPIGPDLLVLPSFDAGAAQVALLSLIQHPSASGTYSVYTAGQGGGGEEGEGSEGHRGHGAPSGTPPPEDEKVTLEAKYAKGPDLTGTLNGAPVAVHTYILTAAKNKWVFFADDANTLLETRVATPPLTYLRSGFKLNPPPAPAK